VASRALKPVGPGPSQIFAPIDGKLSTLQRGDV